MDGNDVCTNMTYTFVYKHNACTNPTNKIVYKSNVCTYLLDRFRFRLVDRVFIVVDLFLTTLILRALKPGGLWVSKGSVYKHDVHICVQTQCVYKPPSLAPPQSEP